MSGGELKKRRNALAMTQAELAEILGVKPNTVARWENGVLAVPKIVALAIETVERAQDTSAKKTAKKGR